MAVRIQINGAVTDLAEGAHVADVLAALGAPQRGVAIAVDGAVVPRAAWSDTVLSEGAQVEVLTAVQGG